MRIDCASLQHPGPFLTIPLYLHLSLVVRDLPDLIPANHAFKAWVRFALSGGLIYSPITPPSFVVFYLIVSFHSVPEATDVTARHAHQPQLGLHLFAQLPFMGPLHFFGCLPCRFHQPSSTVFFLYLI